jgi:hypothetical protein
MRNYIGIDNGVSGSIGIIVFTVDLRIEAKLYKTPIVKRLDYVSFERYLNRIDVVKLEEMLKDYAPEETIVGVERPMVNPMRFRASVSALRALEATLIVVEKLRFTVVYVDSKKWQKELFGKEKVKDLKLMSLEVAKRSFPTVDYTGFGDADGLLIAEYLFRQVWRKEVKDG